MGNPSVSHFVTNMFNFTFYFQICHQKNHVAGVQVPPLIPPFMKNKAMWQVQNNIIQSPCSQYLENYLWVNYTPEVSSNAFLMSICCIVNEKFRENVPAWEVRNTIWDHAFTCYIKCQQLSSQVFKKEPRHFSFFFKCVMAALLAGDEGGLTLKEQTVLLEFLDHCFNSLVCTILYTNWYKYSTFKDWTMPWKENVQNYTVYPFYFKCFIKYWKKRQIPLQINDRK